MAPQFFDTCPILSLQFQKKSIVCLHFNSYLTKTLTLMKLVSKEKRIFHYSQ
jgi:hypothetical protein